MSESASEGGRKRGISYSTFRNLGPIRSQVKEEEKRKRDPQISQRGKAAAEEEEDFTADGRG